MGMASKIEKISVVTISFRDPDGLRKTVDSVRAQQCAVPIEHVVLDGGSGPEVEQYLESIGAGLQYWRSERDNGRYDAMNRGIAQTTGDIVWLMHSGDCFSDPGALQYVVENLSDPRDQWGYAKVRRVGADGVDLGEWGFMPFDLHDFTIGKAPIPHQGSFVGADFAKQLGPYDEEFGLAADQLYLMRAALTKPPVTFDRVVCDFDTTGAGTVRPIKESFADLRRAWDTLGHYPYGTRRRSRLQSRAIEFLVRVAFHGRERVRAMLGRAPANGG